MQKGMGCVFEMARSALDMELATGAENERDGDDGGTAGVWGEMVSAFGEKG